MPFTGAHPRLPCRRLLQPRALSAPRRPPTAPSHPIPRRAYATALDAIPKPPRYGQPLPETHPHLLADGEITPGISASEYHVRRQNLMNALPSGSIVISLGGRIKYMSQGIFYKFRQASDFWYLTGFQEPDSAVVLEKTSDSKGYRMTMFVRSKVPELEQWDGACTGVDAAVAKFGADQAFSISDMTTSLRSLIAPYDHIYVDSPSPKPKSRKNIFDHLSPLSVAIRSDYDSIINTFRSKVRPLAPEVSSLRTIKSPAEQKVLRSAGEISGRAHASTMAFTYNVTSEAQIAAHFEYECLINGAQRLAYVPVVASGANARIIHYTNNDCTIREGELILMDAGCEYNGYASDITRTWPVSGTFTGPQRDLYQAVLNCEKACIKLCTAEAGHSLNDLHQQSVKLLGTELKQIGFTSWTSDAIRRLYPHFLSHLIGIDLHESTYDRGRNLQAGMVITIEPGVYVPPDSAFPKHFHNMGVRVEDCVLVRDKDTVVLSANAPKEIVDVEGCCQRQLA